MASDLKKKKLKKSTEVKETLDVVIVFCLRHIQLSSEYVIELFFTHLYSLTSLVRLYPFSFSCWSRTRSNIFDGVVMHLSVLQPLGEIMHYVPEKQKRNGLSWIMDGWR